MYILQITDNENYMLKKNKVSKKENCPSITRTKDKGKKRFNIITPLTLPTLLYIIIVLRLIQSHASIAEYSFLLSSYFTMIVLTYKKDINNNPKLQVWKAWISIFIFFLSGFVFDSQVIALGIIVALTMLYMIIRNSRAFYLSVKLAEYEANLAIALANIFQIIIAYGIIYKAIFNFIPNSFDIGSYSGSIEEYFNFIYFSFTTFTTLGYGDIVPTHFLSKLLVITEIGIFIGLVTISIVFIVSRKNVKPSKKKKSSFMIKQTRKIRRFKGY